MALNEYKLLTNKFIKNASNGKTGLRLRHSARMNTIVVFVPQQESWIIERMGRFNKILGISYFNKSKQLMALNLNR